MALVVNLMKNHDLSKGFFAKVKGRGRTFDLEVVESFLYDFLKDPICKFPRRLVGLEALPCSSQVSLKAHGPYQFGKGQTGR